MMNQEQRDRLIERYIGRRMSPAEEREFLRLLDRDDTLRRMMETERAVGAALLRDRDAIPTSDRETREQLLAMLGTLPQMSGAAGGGELATASKGSGLLGGALFKSGLALLVAGTMVGAFYLLNNDSSDAVRPGADAASVTATSTRPASPPPISSSPIPSSSPSSASTDTRAATEGKGMTAERGEHGAQAQAPDRAPHGKGAVSAGTPASPVRAEAEEPSSTHATVNSIPSTDASQLSTRPEEPSQPAVQPAARTRDTMRVNVNINLDRLGKKPR